MAEREGVFGAIAKNIEHSANVCVNSRWFNNLALSAASSVFACSIRLPLVSIEMSHEMSPRRGQLRCHAVR
jgi:hypothetical protein